MISRADERTAARLAERAHGVLDALSREAKRETEAWLMPESISVLAFDCLAVTAELARVKDALRCARSDLMWFRDYSGPDGYAEACAAIDRVDAALHPKAGAAE